MTHTDSLCDEYTFTGHSGEVLGIIQLSDGRIVTWSLDNTIKIWDLVTKCSITLTEQTNEILGCIQSEDNLLVSTSMDYTLRFWDLTSNLKIHTASLTSIVHHIPKIVSICPGTLAYCSERYHVQLCFLRYEITLQELSIDRQRLFIKLTDVHGIPNCVIGELMNVSMINREEIVIQEIVNLY